MESAVTRSKVFFMQARNQNLQWRGGRSIGLGADPQPPEAIGVWGQGPQPQEA